MKGHSDHLFKAALEAISRIGLRKYPESARLYDFDESFESDIKNLKLFCRQKAVFGHAHVYIKRRWDIVCLLSGPHRVFYLPNLLLTALYFPEHSIGQHMAFDHTINDFEFMSDAEKEAVHAVRAYVIQYQGFEPPAD